MKTSSVGMFATYGIPAAVTDSTPCHRDSGSSPTVRSVPGPVKCMASSPKLVQQPCAERRCRVHVAAPGGDRVIVVEPHAELDELPEPFEIRLAEHLRGPAGVRDADDRPVVQLLVDLAAVLLGELARACAPDAVAGQVGEQVGLGVTGQRDHRGVLRADPLGALEQPRRRPREHVVGGVLDQRPPHVLVGVEDVDVPRAGPVRGACDGPRDLGVLDAAEHLDELAGLNVRADLNGELGISLDASRGV